MQEVIDLMELEQPQDEMNPEELFSHFQYMYIRYVQASEMECFKREESDWDWLQERWNQEVGDEESRGGCALLVTE